MLASRDRGAQPLAAPVSRRGRSVALVLPIVLVVACGGELTLRFSFECVDETGREPAAANDAVAHALCAAGHAPRYGMPVNDARCAAEWSAGRPQRRCRITTGWDRELIGLWRSVEVVTAARRRVQPDDGERVAQCLEDARIMIDVNCEDGTLPDGQRGADRVPCRRAWFDGVSRVAHSIGWRVGAHERWVTLSRGSMTTGWIARCLDDPRAH